MQNIFDRGTKKWTAIILPEHRKMLEQWMNENESYQPPELDEQYLEEIQRILNQAKHYRSTIGIQYWDQYGERTIFGKVIWMEAGKVRIRNGESEMDIPANQIIGILD